MACYPDHLPPFKAFPAREQFAKVEEETPLVGSSFTRRIRETTPVIFDVSIQATTKVQAQQILAFLETVKGGQAFTVDLPTEFGRIAHTCRWIDEPKNPSQLSTGVWVYTGRMHATELLSA